MDGKIKFDEAGKIIWPEPVRLAHEKKEREAEEVKKFDKILILNYIGTETDGIVKCEFRVEVPEGVEGVRKRIFEVKDWLDKNVERKTKARLWLKKEGDGYLLTVSGYPHSGRCTLCKSFRTALATAMFDLKVAVHQENHCKFED